MANSLLTYTTTSVEPVARALYERYGKVIIGAHRRSDYQCKIDYTKLQDLPVYRLFRNGTRILDQWDETGGILVQYKSHRIVTPSIVLPTCPISRKRFVVDVRNTTDCAVVCLPVSWDLVKMDAESIAFDEHVARELYRYVSHRAKGHTPSAITRFVAKLAGVTTPDYIAIQMAEVQRHLQLTHKTLRHLAYRIGMAAANSGWRFVCFDLIRLFYPPGEERARHYAAWKWIESTPECQGWHPILRLGKDRHQGPPKTILRELVRWGCVERSVGWALFAIPYQGPMTRNLPSRRERVLGELRGWRDQVWEWPEYPLPVEQTAPAEAT